MSQLREARALLMLVMEQCGNGGLPTRDLLEDIHTFYFTPQPHPEVMAVIEADRFNPRKRHVRRTIAGCKLAVGTQLVEGGHDQ